MANNRDTILLETVKTHRARLLAAFLYGELSERRVANDNVKRLVGSIVLAAVVCTVCVGYSLITSLLAGQANKTAAPTANVTPGISDRPYASDNFDRTVRRGWGTAELGGSWTVQGNTRNYAVRGGAAVMEVVAGSNRDARLADTPRESTDVTTTVRSDQFPVTVNVTGRRVDQDYYRAAVRFGAEDQVSLSLISRQDGENVALSDTVSLRPPEGENPDLGTWKIRLQSYGVNPTVVRARVWPEGTSEPDGWTLASEDSFPALQRSGAAGIGAQLPGNGDDGAVSVLDFVARPVI